MRVQNVTGGHLVAGFAEQVQTGARILSAAAQNAETGNKTVINFLHRTVGIGNHVTGEVTQLNLCRRFPLRFDDLLHGVEALPDFKSSRATT